MAPEDRHTRIPEHLNILEVGDRWLFVDALPDNTHLLWTGTRAITANTARRNFDLKSVWRLLCALKGSRYDVIVCHAPLYNPFSLAWLLRLMGRYPLTFPWRWFRTCGVLWLRLPCRTPLIVLDTEDIALINRHNFFLLRKCRAYFKRELPPDHWKAFTKTGHAQTPTARFRRKPFFVRAVLRLRPFSLGISDAKVQQIESALHDYLAGNQMGSEINEENAGTGEIGGKTTDLFFAGAVANSLVREHGMEQLIQLRDQGYMIDIAEPDLSARDYFVRCAKAWLVWSPEGYGWDCFRHYEAAMCGSVPVMNYPAIHRYEPLRHGEHCLLYAVEGNDLRRVIVEALRDKSRLTAMAKAAREHVFCYHTHRNLCRMVLETAFQENDTNQNRLNDTQHALSTE